jgi:hypothetical protein
MNTPKCIVGTVRGWQDMLEKLRFFVLFFVSQKPLGGREYEVAAEFLWKNDRRYYIYCLRLWELHEREAEHCHVAVHERMTLFQSVKEKVIEASGDEDLATQNVFFYNLLLFVPFNSNLFCNLNAKITSLSIYIILCLGKFGLC